MNDTQRDELLVRVDERQDKMFGMVKEYHSVMVSHLSDHKQFRHNIVWRFLCPLTVTLLASGIVALFVVL